MKLSPKISHLKIISILIFFIISFNYNAQETNTECDEDIALSLVSVVNEIRVGNNQIPLVINPILCQIADEHLSDLTARPVNELGDINSRNGTGINSWLQDTDYGIYPNGYLVDMFVHIARDTPPTSEFYENILQFLYDQDNEFDEMVTNNDFREVAIVYNPIERNGNQRYNYVIIFGAQPNVLPIIPIISETFTSEPATTIIDDPFINIIIHNENHVPMGVPQGNVIGSIEYVRDADSANDIRTCPQPGEELINGWQNFEPTNISPYPYQLSGSLGNNEIYIQLCDGAGNTTLSSTIVNYQGPTFIAEPTSPVVIIITPTPDTTSSADATSLVQTSTQQVLDFQTTQVAIRLTQQSITDAVMTSTTQANFDAYATNSVSFSQTQQAQTQEASNQAAYETQIQQTVEISVQNTIESYATKTPINQIASSPTSTVTVTPSPTSTATVMPSPTSTATVMPSPTSTATVMPSPTSTATVMPSPTSTATITLDAVEEVSPIVPSISVPFTLRLYWDTRYLIIYNPEDTAIVGSDLVNLKLDNEDISYPFLGNEIIRIIGTEDFLFDARHCIIIFNGANTDIPALVDAQSVFDGCEGNELTASIGIGPDRMPWLSNYDFFNAYFGEELIATCYVSESRCNVPQTTIREITEPEIRGSGETMTLAWTPDMLILWNRSQSNVDLSGIAFEVGSRRFTWNAPGYGINENYLENIEAGDCIIAYSFASYPEDRPMSYSFSDINCRNNIESMIAAAVASNNVVWDRTGTGISFTVFFDEVVLGNCSGTRCEFQLP